MLFDTPLRPQIAPMSCRSALLEEMATQRWLLLIVLFIFRASDSLDEHREYLVDELTVVLFLDICKRAVEGVAESAAVSLGHVPIKAWGLSLL